MRKRKVDLSGIPPLTDFFTVKENVLTIVGAKVLKLYAEGTPQSVIARRLGTSRQHVNYYIRKLRKHALIGFDKNAGGVSLPPFDVRFRYFYYKLTKPVQLPYDEEHFTKGVKNRVWRVKDCLIYSHYGKNTNSIEITAGFAGGNSKDEAIQKHDQKCNNLWNWLIQHFPELKESAGPLEIHRGGELALNKLRGVAAEALKESGASIIKGDGFKVDQSRGWPELQVYFDEYAKKQDIASLMELIHKQTVAINELATNLKELTETSKKPLEKPPSGIYG